MIVFNDFYPFTQNIPIDSDIKKQLINSFTTTQEVLEKPAKKKNIIFMIAESLELQSLGIYNHNPNYKSSMPFLSSLSQKSTICVNVSSQPYTTWSAAGFMVSQCSFPHIVSEVTHSSRSHELLTQWGKIPCISSFLTQAGYKAYIYSDNTLNFMGQKAFMKQHGISVTDKHDRKVKSDFELFHYLTNEIVPNLIKNYHEKSENFFLAILNEDTHPPYRRSSECKNVDPKLNHALQSYTCFDEAFQHFYETITTKYGVNETNTEMLIYGDHLSMGMYGDSFQDKRKLAIIFPFLKKGLITKPVTYYDIAPTVLKLMGIKYRPQFPFGEDIFSNKIGLTPKAAEFNFLYDFVVKKMMKKESVCHGKQGVCTSNEY